MHKISVIVPVYNAEKYLNRCVDSILNQTHTNIELILVNDGSVDNSGDICDLYTTKDARVCVVHKQNGGLSSARNAGLAVATGEYVGFVDSDDDVELDMYEKLYDIAYKQQVDFVMSDYIRILQDGKTYLKTLDIDAGKYDKEKIVSDLYPRLIMGKDLEYGPLLSVCHCIYRREFLERNGLTFDEKVRWSEDNIFSAFVGYYADSFYYLKGEGLYHYHSNPGTITTSYRKGAWDVYCTMNKHLRTFFSNIKEFDFSQQLKLHLIFYACNCIGQEIGRPFKEAIKEIDRILASNELKEAFKGFDNKNINFKLKIQLYLMKWEQGKLLYYLKKR